MEGGGGRGVTEYEYKMSPKKNVTHTQNTSNPSDKCVIYFIIFPLKFTTYYDIIELGKKLNKVKNSLIANHRVIRINISRKSGPFVRAIQLSTVHIFYCNVDLECLHANCVYHSTGGSLV